MHLTLWYDTLIWYDTFGRSEECSVWTKTKHSSTNSHFFLIHMLVTHDLRTDHHWIPQIAEGREDLVLKIEIRDKFRRSSTKKETALAWLIHLVRFTSSILRCRYGMLFRTIWTRLIGRPMRISWDLTRPSARCCTWAGTTPGISTVWGWTYWEQPCWEGLGVDERLAIFQQSALASQKTNFILGFIQSSTASRGKRGFFSSAPVRSHLQCCTQFWGPQHKQDIDILA